MWVDSRQGVGTSGRVRGLGNDGVARAVQRERAAWRVMDVYCVPGWFIHRCDPPANLPCVPAPLPHRPGIMDVAVSMVEARRRKQQQAGQVHKSAPAPASSNGAVVNAAA